MRMKLKLITLTIISLLFSKLVTAETAPGFGSWDDVLKAADGGQVNVYMWGGSDAINGFVDDFYGVPLKEKYNITLNRVPLKGSKQNYYTVHLQLVYQTVNLLLGITLL